ncbi:Methanogenic corrinoid protein MtbC1 [Neorhodopirellula lusitana]|uniref:Methanogenic corrinoid protein MtbC1 n=2 Tax=Neorhodopirellula lusitana TaxID=445327 RepID=A0ABY1PUK1_9BACT|nr:Methanogenic corrinoid protein MtbC1 [Neorhodopirellula lusitana]
MAVGESTVKRWCDSGAISTTKTSGGHRKIGLDSLQHFLHETEKCIAHPEVLGLPNLAPSRTKCVCNSKNPVSQAFCDALVCGDEATCRKLVFELVESGSRRSEVAESLITSTMYGFGEAWACNQIDVYQERRGCDIVMGLLHELRRSLPKPDACAPVAIGGAPEGDPYQLPTAMVELALLEAGWNATNLGCDLPLDSIQTAARDYAPQLVWLSISAVSDQDRFVAAQNEFAESLSDDVTLLVGGRAVSGDLRRRLVCTAHCTTLRHLVDLAEMPSMNSGKRSPTQLPVAGDVGPPPVDPESNS